MNTYKITLSVQSALSTPLQGDTLFGHICWGIRWTEGENALLAFLKEYEAEEPPLIISNGFPAGSLPRPLLQPAPADMPLKASDYPLLKKVKKINYLPADWFFDPGFRFSETGLFERLASEELPLHKATVRERMHNTIDRLGGTVKNEGGLYALREFWYSKETEFDVYVLSTYPGEKVKELFKDGLQNGFGADKSTGKGTLNIEAIQDVKFSEKGNRFMALGNFVPDANQECNDLRADLFTKYGKLGGDYVFNHNPFKKPILMYREGATFSSESGKLYIGSLLWNVHQDPAIRHHAFAPVIRYNETEVTS